MYRLMVNLNKKLMKLDDGLYIEDQSNREVKNDP